jgi:hypothetical protein
LLNDKKLSELLLGMPYSFKILLICIKTFCNYVFKRCIF